MDDDRELKDAHDINLFSVYMHTCSTISTTAYLQI